MINTLEETYKSTLKFLEPLTLQEAYKVTVDEALKLAQANFGAILLREEDGFKNVYSNVPKRYITKARKRGYAYQSYITAEPVVVSYSNLIKAHPELKKNKC